MKHNFYYPRTEEMSEEQKNSRYDRRNIIFCNEEHKAAFNKVIADVGWEAIAWRGSGFLAAVYMLTGNPEIKGELFLNYKTGDIVDGWEDALDEYLSYADRELAYFVLAALNFYFINVNYRGTGKYSDFSGIQNHMFGDWGILITEATAIAQETHEAFNDALSFWPNSIVV